MNSPTHDVLLDTQVRIPYGQGSKKEALITWPSWKNVNDLVQESLFPLKNYGCHQILGILD